MKEKLCIKRKKIDKDDVGKDAFFPVYESDNYYLSKCKYNTEILCGAHKGRNLKFHKLIFAIAKCVIENANEDSIVSKMTPYNFIKACMRAEGIVDMEFNFDGSIDYTAKSINFINMDDDDFRLVGDACFKWGSSELGIEEHILRREYLRFL